MNFQNEFYSKVKKKLKVFKNAQNQFNWYIFLNSQNNWQDEKLND